MKLTALSPSSDLIAILLIGLCITGSLMGFDIGIVRAEYRGVYLFDILALLVIFYSLFKQLLTKVNLIGNPAPIIFMIYGFYTVLHGVLFTDYFNLYHGYILISCLLAITLPIICTPSNFSTIVCIVLLLAFIESVVCLLQMAGFMGSFSSHFQVTGTFENPNVTAMFIAMACCSIPYILCIVNPGIRKFIIVAVVIILIALFSLGCRTAWLGLVGAGIVPLYLNSQSLLEFIKSFFKKTVGIITGVFLLLLLLSLASRMYQVKKESADGRKLIWKISSQMIAERPLFGYGFGHFEKHYNLYQANYFQNGNGSPSERRNADHVNMAYNEFLQQGIMGGVIGILLFAGILVSVLVPSLRRLRHSIDVNDSNSRLYAVALSGVICFITMGLFNFTQDAIPVWLMFLIFVAFLISEANRTTKQKRPSNVVTAFNFCLTMGSGLLLLVYLYNSLFKEHQISSFLSSKEKKIGSWEAMLPIASADKSFWIGYGQLHLKRHNFSQAREKFKIALNLCSEKDVFIKIALCDINLGNHQEAISNYRLVADMQPTWLLPKYQLLKIYHQMVDTPKVIEQAREILSIIPKGKKSKGRAYHEYASKLLAQYEPKPFTPLIHNSRF